jgi:catechol 2,3-dioxygenase-like lactoylglutathione lyase family enzyme
VSTAETWPAGVGALTLFVEDLPEAKAFYTAVFDLSVLYEDESSAAFRFGNTVVNLLRVQAASALIDPAPVGAEDTASRSVFTVEVDDVDAHCARLAGLGVELLNGPMDRPWGPRTASFRAPGGQIWELAH